MNTLPEKSKEELLGTNRDESQISQSILVTYDALAALNDTRRSLDAWMDELSDEGKAALGEALAARFERSKTV